MADERRVLSLFNWEQLFSAACGLLDECERLWGTSNVSLRETVQIRLEALIHLSYILILLSLNKSCRFSREICLLHEHWIREQSSSCTELAIYSLDAPQTDKVWQSRSTEVFHVGRYASRTPFVEIPEDIARQLSCDINILEKSNSYKFKKY